MLDLINPGKTKRKCDGSTRRDFLKIGTLGLSSFCLPDLLRARAQARGSSVDKNTSVVWLWLGGGATHIETFDPKMTAPAEYRSIIGSAKTSIPGVEIGGLFPEMARRAGQMAFVRSFTHGNSGHAGGTHFVMTGVDHPPADNGAPPIRPSIGSIVSRVRGANHPDTGLPTYVRIAGLYADGPHWLGPAFAPFDSGGQARNNLELKVDLSRLGDRRGLLKKLDSIDRKIDQTGLMNGLDEFDHQAFDLILGKAKQAFDLSKEDPRVRDRYKDGTHTLGEQLLLARRLCEAGCGFVTLHYANSNQGWDMHNQMTPQLKQACPPMDRAIATFLDDLAQRGLSERVLLVITGEFGRTPRINGDAGRDHWGPLCTLALAGGGLKMGQAVGESSEKAEVPKSRPITPQDLMATIFHVLGIDRKVQFKDPSGRPTYMIEHGEPIAELV
jgi:hypothetical protein